MPGETAGVPNNVNMGFGNGLFDFLKTPQGQALASGLATYAATARRGTPINNLGRGMLGGITGYGNAIESQQQSAMQAQKDAYNQKQQELLGLHYGNEKFRVETERKRLEQQRQAQISEAKMFLPGFVKASGMSGQGFDFDEEGNIFPVEMPNAQPVSANVDWMQGADDEYKSMIASAMQSGDPTVRRQAVNEMYRYYRDARKGSKEAKDYIAKERAMAEALGVTLKEYLQQKSQRSPLVQFNSPLAVMSEEAGKKAGGKEGYDIGEQAAMIENKYSAIDSVREAREMLKQGIYSGYWGDMGKTISKASMGAIGDRQKAARTEQFMAYVGNTVVPRLKEFGGNDSNEEMRYLQRIMGGDTSMEPEAIASILESAERKIQRGIERLQRQRGALEQGKMPDLGPGPARQAPAKPATTPKPVLPHAPPQAVRKYNPATGRIE